MIAWPGEPTTGLGLQVEEIAARAGARQAWVLGLANDHLGYFVTPEEFDHGGYESCASFYGPHGGESIIAALRGLLRSPDFYP